TKSPKIVIRRFCNYLASTCSTMKKGHGFYHVLFFLAHTLPQVLAEKPLLNWNVCGSQGAVGSRLTSRDGSCWLGRQRLGRPNHSVRVGAVIGRAGALPGNRTRAHGVVAEGLSGGGALHEVFVAALGARSKYAVDQAGARVIASGAGPQLYQCIGIAPSRIVG